MDVSLDKIIKDNDIDCNLILNVPEEIGEKIHKLINEQCQENPNSKINIEIIENPSESINNVDDSRKMILNFNNELHPITILDLPCIIEAQKTIDYKSFYKCSDISQMMYVHDDIIKKEEDLIKFNPLTDTIDKKFQKLLWTKDPDHKYKLKHGLSKATRNIRMKRFKRKLKYNKDEILEVAKKLKSIIDNGAANYDNKTIKTETYENNNDKKNEKEPKSNNILSIPFDESEDEEKKSKKKKIKNKTQDEDNNGIIKIDFNASAEDESLEDKKFQLKKEMQDNYKKYKEEYMAIKKELEKPENANNQDLIKRKKKIKKELRAIKAQYNSENS